MIAAAAISASFATTLIFVAFAMGLLLGFMFGIAVMTGRGTGA